MLTALQLLDQFASSPRQGLQLGLELQVVSTLDQQSIDRDRSDALLPGIVPQSLSFLLDCLGLFIEAMNRLVRLSHGRARLISLTTAKLQDRGESILKRHACDFCVTAC
jgi:hypothetical protein